MKIQQGAVPNSADYSKGRNANIRYLVIHFTANNGDTALNNVNYFKNNVTASSAHFFVDERDILTSVPETDTAWHCGAKQYLHAECRNANSIGIEMCSRKKNGEYYILEETVNNTIWLVQQLMKKYGIPTQRVVRHYDVTGKNCPEPMVKNTGLWQNFIKQLKENPMEERIQTLENTVARLENKMVYHYIDQNMPEWARESVAKLVRRGALCGNEDGELGLTDEMLKIFTVLDRLGLFA